MSSGTSPTSSDAPDQAPSDRGASAASDRGELPVLSREVPFSLALDQEQKDVRDWVHGFAADIVRAAAHEWDEREQTPWPIIQEAAKIGLYSWEGLTQFLADPSGLTLPLVNEELFWATPASAWRSWGPVSP